MLLNTIDRVKEILPVNVSFDFQKLKPFVIDAERIIEETIGTELYTELNTQANLEPPEADAVKDTVIRLLQEPITYLGFYFGFDILNTVFSNQGFHRIENEESGKKALFQRQEENLKLGFKHQGYNRLDMCLKHLEKNKNDFATWTGSDSYTLLLRNFINSTDVFTRIYNIGGSRLVFQKLRNYQTIVEDFDILPLIGREFFDELKLQIKEDNLTPENSTFLELLQKVVAFRAIHRGGVELLAELNEYGIYQQKIVDNTRNFKTQNAAAQDLYETLFGQAKTYGHSYLKVCENFLKANINDYPTYEDSSAYDDSGSVFNLEGTNKIGII